jgi:hypothetical protein
LHFANACKRCISCNNKGMIETSGSVSSGERNSEDNLDLAYRIGQFANMLGVNPELLQGLKFCHKCNGAVFLWDDLTLMDIGDWHIDDEDYSCEEYRAQVAESICDACDGSGFEGGDFKFTAEEWIRLGQLKL